MKVNRKRKLSSYKNILFILVLLVGMVYLFNQVIFLSSMRFGTGLPSEMEYYSSKFVNFKIEHPKSWGVTELQQGDHGDLEVVAVIHPTGISYPMVIISRKKMIGGKIENITAWGMQRASKCKKFLSGQIKSSDFQGLQGTSFEYSCEVKVNYITQAEDQAKCIEYNLIQGDDGYSLSFCSGKNTWDEVNPVFEKMIESFILN